MKLTLTLKEVTDIVRKSMKIPVGEQFTIEIVGMKEMEMSLLESSLLTAIREFPHYATDQKISAIRRFRELVGDRSAAGTVLLIDAKYVIDNVAEALDNIRKYGKIRP